MRIFLPIAFIILLTVAAFFTSLNNGFVNWDDPFYVVENYSIRSLCPAAVAGFFARPQSSYYAPLVFISFAVDFHYWELNPFGYHLTNLLFHIFNALLAYFFLRRLSGNTAAALIAALLFALNPLRVESVAWITERKDVLSVFFYLAAMIFYLRSRSSGVSTINRWYFFSLAAALCALLSKPMAVTIPLALLLLDYHLYRSRRAQAYPPLGVLMVNKIPFLLFSSTLGWVAIFLQRVAGAVRPAFYLDPWPHLLTAARNFVFYLYKSLLPVNLSAFYPYPELFAIFRPAFFVPVVVLGILIILFIRFGRRDSDLTLGAGFYALTILPALQLVPVGGVIFADRFSYLPSLGVFYPIGLFLARLAVRSRLPGESGLPGTVRRRATVLLSITVMVVSWGALSSQRCRVWRDSVTLWTDVLKKSPDIPAAHLNLGEALLGEGRLTEAVEALRRSKELDPAEVSVYTNLGDAYQKLGLLDKAEKELMIALEIDPENPLAHNNLGLLYAEQGRTAAARESYLTAIALGGYAEPHNNLGILYRSEGKLAEAISQYEKAVSINPRYRSAHHNLAAAFDQSGDFERAISHYRRAIELEPDFVPAYRELGFAYAKAGLLAAAAAEFKKAVELEPESGLNYYCLALCRYFQGDHAAAVLYRDQAIRFGYREIHEKIMELK